MEPIKELRDIFEANGISFVTDDMFERLNRFYELVVETNKVMNLTGITEFHEFAVKHYVDSLAVCRVMKIPDEFSLIDVGTGAGFPGVPLAICFPKTSVTLLDSSEKRVHFLQRVTEELKLSNVYIVKARAEEAANQIFLRDKYNIAVARAVANLSTLVEYSLPFVRPGGTFVAYKGPNAAAEIHDAGHALSVFGARVDHIHSFELECNGEKNVRNLLFIAKDKPTPKGYPRTGAKIAKKPL